MTEIIIRELQPDQDLDRWLRLVWAVEMKETGSALRTEAQLRRMLEWPRTKRWVAEAPGDPETLIGEAFLFAQIKERSALDLTVHPDWRGRGVGSRLLTFLMQEAQKIGAQWANFEINETNSACLAFLHHHQFQYTADTWLLRAPIEARFDLPVWPEGFRIRSYADIADSLILLQACNRSFADLWGHHENTAGGLTAEQLNRWLPGWDSRGILIVFSPQGDVAGYCRAESGAYTGEDEDLLDQPGIAPQYRPLHLHRPLALAAARWLRDQGSRPIRLESWGDSLETVSLYQQIGFQLVEHGLSYRHPLEPRI